MNGKIVAPPDNRLFKTCA